MKNRQSTKRKKKKVKDASVYVRLDADQLEVIDSLKERLNASGRADVFRQGIPWLVRHVENMEATDAPELKMSGGAETIQWKNVVIECLEKGHGVSRAARTANVTARTVYYQLENDPIFAQLCEEAKNLCVEDVENSLFRMATKEKPNVTAMLAYLNAHHPDYGQIRTQVLQRILGPFIDRIVKLVEKFVPPGYQDEFVKALGRDAERVCLEAAGGKR